MQPDEFISTAERLLVGADREADKRSAISRAYYGALHESRESLPAAFALSEADMSSCGSHKAVIDRLRRWSKAAVPGRRDAGDAARSLSSLKHARNHADYELGCAVDEIAVSSCVSESKRIVALVRDARALFDRQTDRKGI
jgi:hypothetical protein